MDSTSQSGDKVDEVIFADGLGYSMDSETQGSEPRDSCWRAELVSLFSLLWPQTDSLGNCRNMTFRMLPF